MSHTRTPWTDILAANWQNTPQTVVLTDLSRCSPKSALSERMKCGCWRVAEYEAGGLQGKMLLACPDSKAATASLPLEATGPHAVFVGIYSTRTCPSQIWLKLDTDVAAVSRSSRPAQGMWSIEEIFFKVAQLNATSLQVIQQNTGITSSCGIAYVKLIPLTEEEHACYPSTYQQTSFTAAQCHPSPIYGYGAEALRELERQGINYARVLIDGAHDMGMNGTP